MKRIAFIFIGFVILLVGCRKEHVAPINSLVKDLFCFNTGSEWTYYDSVSQTTQKMVVTNYETTRWGAIPSGKGKLKDIAEGIEISIDIENTNRNGKTILTSFLGYESQDNTAEGTVATPAGADFSLRIRCDENDNFTPSATYLSTYTVNETTYSDVYMFNSTFDFTHRGNITYYVAKHIGLIRYIFQCENPIYNFDWILINKNIQQ